MIRFNDKVLTPRLKILFFLFFTLISVNGFTQSHNAEKFIQDISGTKNEGAKIVKHYCSSCHGAKPLIQVGAPTIGNEEQWKIRFEKNYELVLKNTYEGFNLMPPRGGCFECSDEQLKLAILDMLPENLKKELSKTLSALKKNT